MKTAIIGVGQMGSRHIQVVRDLGLELVGVCDQRGEALTEAGNEHGVQTDQRFADVPTLLEQTRPDCVIIATAYSHQSPEPNIVTPYPYISRHRNVRQSLMSGRSRRPKTIAAVSLTCFPVVM